MRKTFFKGIRKMDEVTVSIRTGRPLKISKDKWDDVKRDYNSGLTVKEVAEKWGVSKSTVSKILHSGEVRHA